MNENNDNNNIDKNYTKKNKKRISNIKKNRNEGKKSNEQDKILIEDYKNKYNIRKYKNLVKEKVIISNEIKNYFLLKKNNNILTNNTLIILIKSSSKNINVIVEVIYSLLFQSANISSYQCFIILNKKDFLNGNDDLPVDLKTLIENKWVTIIWDKNIFTFIKFYQENDIMIVEDNILRNFDYIEMFQHDHKIYPNDVLCGIFSYNFDSEMKLNKLNGYKLRNGLEINVVPNMIFQTSMPLYGIGGVYYPKHTFSDERFFNEMLYKKISSSSYEMWLYAFNIIEDKILRQTSKIYDFSLNILDKNKCLTIESLNIENEILSSINERIIEYIPEYKSKSIERQKKLIVSITSYKQRFKKLHLVLESIFNNSLKPYKVILTIYKGDYEYLTEEIMNMVNEKRLELIETEIDFKPHKKYFDVMKKYKDYAIITIDDDVIYTSDLIESMYKSYMKYPNCVHGRVVHKYQMIRGSNEIAPYRKWKKRYTNEINPSYDLLAVGIGGILYPPDILNISDFNINEIFKCITADDIYLKYLEIKKNIKTVWVPYKTFYWEKELRDDETQKYALYKNNMKGLNLNDKYIKIFNIVP
ncbi:hypothetical protein H8356DRAFT_1064608 [Neocallimastix lanati (nom. inval.)]|nr:hypothetical protein H8356DRAFT_1064604 [Neocallimastix sp. JGI-2020a]KAG4083695.1 hypothetical protein H8356DRAFT_1064608 [Neocallimastix sp. JGI-2020a]